MNSVKSISDIIDMDMNSFKSYVKRTKNMTELTGLKKSLELEYSHVESVKNGVLSEQKDHMKDKKVVETLDSLYKILLIIEEKCRIIEEEKKVRNVRL